MLAVVACVSTEFDFHWLCVHKGAGQTTEMCEVCPRMCR